MKKTLYYFKKAIIYTIFLYFVYFNSYYYVSYINDADVFNFLNKYQQELDDLIAAKERDCGKYFQKKEEKYYDSIEEINKIKYEYVDNFFLKVLKQLILWKSIIVLL